MGFKGWVRKHLSWFDQQIESYPSEAERPRPVSAAAPPRRNPGPVARRTPAAPPAHTSRHRLDPTRRPRRDDHDDVADVADAGINAAALESATPRWVDEPGHHDHRHHGHGAAAEHRVDDTPSTSHHTTHHGGHSHDSGGHSHSAGHDSGGYDGGGYGCGGGGGD